MVETKELIVPYLNFRNGESAQGDSPLFGEIPKIPIDELNWPEFPYCPSVSVQATHNNRSIWLRFHVKEKHISCKFREVNDPVYRDSCVEFFISFAGDHYYNFEFNCLGTPYAAFGPANLALRNKLPAESLRNLYRSAELQQDGDAFSWSLNVEIPSALLNTSYTSEGLSGRSARANFFKCGDDLPEPHYLSWNPIAAPSPNFHRPDFFGTLFFEEP